MKNHSRRPKPYYLTTSINLFLFLLHSLIAPSAISDDDDEVAAPVVVDLGQTTKSEGEKEVKSTVIRTISGGEYSRDSISASRLQYNEKTSNR